MQRKCLMINPKDTVVMLLEDAKKGDTVQTVKGEITLLEDIEFAHKVSIVDKKKGDPVIKYGEEIGYMLKDAPAGTWIHNHIMGCERGTK
ncbi:MAG: UxaA family hydrolase [Lawsonibacter sp.]